MRTYACLSILLGLVTFLTIRYSFWVAFGIMYSGGMFLVVLIALTAKNNESRTSRSKVLDDGKRQLIVEGRTASEAIKTT